MNRKTITMALGAILLGAFFLAYYKFFGFTISGLDMATAKDGSWERFLLFLLPLSGVLLLVGALNNEHYFIPRAILNWIPLLTLVFIMILNPLIKGAGFGDVIKSLGKGYGIGMWLTLVSAIVLVAYNPRPKE